MLPRPEWWLAGWTAVAATWWGSALWLVRRREERESRPLPSGRPDGSSAGPELGRQHGGGPAGEASGLPRFLENRSSSLSIFKPLPPLRGSSPGALAAALESFVCQLDDATELLLGIEDQDGPVWKPILKAWEQKYPTAKVRYVCQPRSLELISPKVSWHRILSEYARGELWLWSDADILAPPGLLATLRQEANGGLVTCLYAIRQVAVAPQMLEMLFVNVEMIPGILACERAGALRFGFGAALLFRAEDFRQRVGWAAVSRMAEDYVMGRELQPVTLSAVTVETIAAERHWPDALRHYLRWQKTVRWNRPGGFAGLVLVMPALGWLVCGQWAGLAVTLALEAAVAAWLCDRAGCPLRWRQLWVLPVWSLLRPVAWLLCWLPIPVVFRSQGRVWSSVNHSRGTAS